MESQVCVPVLTTSVIDVVAVAEIPVADKRFVQSELSADRTTGCLRMANKIQLRTDTESKMKLGMPGVMLMLLLEKTDKASTALAT